MTTLDENYRSVYEDGKNRVHPFVVPKLMNNAAAGHVSMEFNLKGPSFHGLDGLRLVQPCHGAGFSDGAWRHDPGDDHGWIGIDAVFRRR